MANELKALDREQILYFNDTVASGLTLPEALGGLSTQYPIFDGGGNRRLVGIFASSQAPAAGFPRVRFFDSPLSTATVRATYVFDEDTNNSSTQNVYKLDCPLLTPWFTIEWTMGGTGANVFGVAWIYPEDGGGDFPASGGGGTVVTRPATYRCVISALTVPIGGFVELRNPAASGRVLRVSMEGIFKPTVTMRWTIRKQSTLNTGGTASQPTVVPLDSNNTASVGVVNAYTVAPTLGTLVGNVWDDPAVTAGDRLVDTPGELDFTQPIVLRAGESICMVSDVISVVTGILEFIESAT